MRAMAALINSRADLLLRQMQLKAAKVLARGCIRRPVEKGREGPNVADVVLPGRFAEAARGHVGRSLPGATG